MPYCPNCGNETDRTHYYCGQCRKELNDGTDSGEAAPITTHHSGFLSERTTEHLSEVHENGIEEDHPDLTHLERDLAAALVDFGIVGPIEDLNLLEILASGSKDDFFNKTESGLMLLGLFRLARLDDQSIGTAWEEEMSNRLTTAVEKRKTNLEATRSRFWPY